MRTAFHARNAAMLAGLAVVMVAVSAPPAKEARSAVQHGIKRSLMMTGGELAAFEQRLTPYFTYVAAHRAAPTSGSCYVPDQIDRNLILRYAKLLSPSFLALYKRAIDIPSDFASYVSPGGHFEVFYTTADTDPADTVPRSDTYGFSDQNWRAKVNVPNGVPDYVDEVAWACDSAWSMEVDRFGFPAPPGWNRGTQDSSLFKVVVKSLDYGYYGVTDPDTGPTGSHGYASLVNIRNEWNDPAWGDYQTHPYNAVRITIAHEFFHGVQYGMTWNVQDGVYLDNFTVGWIEGTAVLMEGLGYDSIKDYLQYVGDYYSDPYAPMLSNDFGSDNLVPYKNSLMTKFLYERVPPQPGIGFIKTMFTRNNAAPTGFLANLQQTGLDYGTTWVDVLGAFHSQSFFTGSNATSAYFIKDAALLPTLTYATDAGLVNTKDIAGFGCQTFSIQNGQYQGDTLKTYLAAAGPLNDDSWAANIVLHGAGPSTPDTVIPMRVRQGIAADTMQGWQRYHDAVVVVSNGHDLGSTPGSVTVSFNVPVSPFIAGEFYVYPNPLRLANVNDSVRFTGLPITSVRIFTSTGTLAYEKTSPTPVQSMGWKPAVSGGSKVCPGTYIALVGYRTEGSAETNYRTNKVMIAP